MTQTAPGKTTSTIVRAPGMAERDPVRHGRWQRAQELTLAFGLPLLLLSLWQFAASRGAIDERLFPPPLRVAQVAWQEFNDADFYGELRISLGRMLAGFGIGVASGIIVGVLMGISRLTHAALDLLLSALYTVPKLALLPLFLIIFGIGETPLVLMIAITVFFFMWIETMEAIRGVSPAYLEPILVYRRSRWQTFWHALWPASLPRIFVGLKVSAAVSVLTLVAVEFLQASEGVGHNIWFSWSLFRADQMYFGIALVSMIGVAFTKLIEALGYLAMPWMRKRVKGH